MMRSERETTHRQQLLDVQTAVTAAGLIINSNLFYFARRCSSSSAGQWENGVLLRNRGLIEVTGVDGRLLVNGLATADVLTAPLSTQYNMFLNTQVEISQDTTRILYTISAQGRVLYDSLIYHVNEERMLIECDRIIERKLLNHLKMYALRKKVS